MPMDFNKLFFWIHNHNYEVVYSLMLSVVTFEYLDITIASHKANRIIAKSAWLLGIVSLIEKWELKTWMITPKPLLQHFCCTLAPPLSLSLQLVNSATNNVINIGNITKLGFLGINLESLQDLSLSRPLAIESCK